MTIAPAAVATVLFAAGFDWLEAILPILFVGFWILSQVFAVLRKVTGGPARPPVVGRVERPRDVQPPPLPDTAPRTELERQIAEFLRQTKGEAGRAKAPPKEARARQRTDAPRRPGATEAGTPSRVQPTPKPVANGSVRQPERPMGTLDAGQSEVARHVADAFAHELGHLHSGLESPPQASPSAARRATEGDVMSHDLLRVARDPATMRRAVLLREILERPVERWE